MSGKYGNPNQDRGGAGEPGSEVAVAAPDTESRWKRRLFAAVTLSVPILAFIALEGGLRLVGFGSGYPLFVPVEGAPEYLRMNPEVGHRFFFGDVIIPGVTRDLFRRERTPRTYRLVVQGGSTALGYPYFYGGAFPRMLEWRLQASFPEREIEVVNTAMTAVNSYTLLDFADEIVAIDPDAILIYAGHNEYYGALGVGSSQSVGGSRSLIRTWIALRRLRTVQLLRGFLARIRSVFASEADPWPRTQMERLVGEQTIPFGSPLFERGVEQFRANLADLLERYRHAGIPVFVATLVSNERDQPPFISAPHPGVGPEEWERARNEALEVLARGDSAAARARLAGVAARDSSDAAAFYEVARSLDRARVHHLARELYLGAKDRDQLRFRAPEVLNAVIRRLVERTGATVVEVQDAFARESPDGIVGSGLISEHLHPRLRGYFLIADAFYEALATAGEIGSWERRIPREEARRDLPYTVLDSLYGEIQIRALTAGWPFRAGDEPAATADAPPEGASDAPPEAASEDPPARLAAALFRRQLTWPRAIRALYAYYEASDEHGRARHVARALAQELPDLPLPYVLWGSAALRAGETAEAVRVLETADRLAPSHQTAALLGSALLAAGERTRALQLLERAAASAPPGEPVPRAALSAARALPELERAAGAHPRDPERLYELAVAYAAVNQPQRARAALGAVLELDPSHARARELFDRLAPKVREAPPDGARDSRP